MNNPSVDFFNYYNSNLVDASTITVPYARQAVTALHDFLEGQGDLTELKITDVFRKNCAMLNEMIEQDICDLKKKNPSFFGICPIETIFAEMKKASSNPKDKLNCYLKIFYQNVDQINKRSGIPHTNDNPMAPITAHIRMVDLRTLEPKKEETEESVSVHVEGHEKEEESESEKFLRQFSENPIEQFGDVNDPKFQQEYMIPVSVYIQTIIRTIDPKFATPILISNCKKINEVVEANVRSVMKEHPKTFKMNESDTIAFLKKGSKAEQPDSETDSYMLFDELCSKNPFRFIDISRLGLFQLANVLSSK